jgi:hypothetical protein
MPYDEAPKEIDRLPNPKWSKQKMELHPRKALFPWWVWPIVFLAAVLTFIVVWFGFVLPSIRAKEAALYTPTPTITPTPPPPTGLPPVPATAEPTAFAMPTATVFVIPTPSGDIAVGGKVRVTGTGTARLNLRESPSTSATILTRVEDGREFTVVEGPTSADGYQWWKVQDAAGTITGWAAANYLQPIP